MCFVTSIAIHESPTCSAGTTMLLIHTLRVMDFVTLFFLIVTRVRTRLKVDSRTISSVFLFFSSPSSRPYTGDTRLDAMVTLLLRTGVSG
jgi:hypothetical protein